MNVYISIMSNIPIKFAHPLFFDSNGQINLILFNNNSINCFQTTKLIDDSYIINVTNIKNWMSMVINYYLPLN
jgi:hypothetical protein